MYLRGSCPCMHLALLITSATRFCSVRVIHCPLKAICSRKCISSMNCLKESQLYPSIPNIQIQKIRTTSKKVHTCCKPDPPRSLSMLPSASCSYNMCFANACKSFFRRPKVVLSLPSSRMAQMSFSSRTLKNRFCRDTYITFGQWK